MSTAESLTVIPDAVTGNRDLLKPVQVAKAIGIGKRTLSRWLSEGQFPGPDMKVGTRILRWQRATVDGWIAARCGK